MNICQTAAYQPHQSSAQKQKINGLAAPLTGQWQGVLHDAAPIQGQHSNSNQPSKQKLSHVGADPHQRGEESPTVSSADHSRQSQKANTTSTQQGPGGPTFVPPAHSGHVRAQSQSESSNLLRSSSRNQAAPSGHGPHPDPTHLATAQTKTPKQQEEVQTSKAGSKPSARVPVSKTTPVREKSGSSVSPIEVNHQPSRPDKPLSPAPNGLNHASDVNEASQRQLITTPPVDLGPLSPEANLGDKRLTPADPKANSPLSTTITLLAGGSGPVSGALANLTGGSTAPTVAGSSLGHSAGLSQMTLSQLTAQLTVLRAAGGGVTLIRMDPPSLGRIEARLSINQGQQAQLTLQATQAATAHMLQANLPQLATALQQQGFVLTQTHLLPPGQGAHQTAYGNNGSGPNGQSANGQGTHGQDTGGQGESQSDSRPAPSGPWPSHEHDLTTHGPADDVRHDGVRAYA